jgi:hypothetical protein
MRKVMVAVLVTSFFLAWLSLGLAAEPTDDSIYYTRIGFFYEKGTHKTTNYLRGTWVPINTKVEVLKKTATQIGIRMVGTGEKVKIANKRSISGEGIDGIFDRMFSRDATDLTAYSPKQVKNIMAGNYDPGMTKEEIILAIGYPPKHQTSSLDRNAWRYWRSKFDTVLLYFEDDVLDHMVD